MKRPYRRSAGRDRYRAIRTFEALEARRLLAGDLCTDDLPAADQVIVAGSVTAADAGATPATAYDLGIVDGARAISGRLGWFDYVDMFSFHNRA